MSGSHTVRALLGLCVLFALVGCGDDAPTDGGGGALLSWDFADDAGGWEFGISGIDGGKALRATKQGGIMELDGVGNNDPGPNAWGYRSIALPANASTFRFLTSAHDRSDGTGFLRVRLRVGAGAWQEIMELEMMETGPEGYDWEERSLDISTWAGQTVTIQFELEDIDGGGNNQRYIDDIEVRSP